MDFLSRFLERFNSFLHLLLFIGFVVFVVRAAIVEQALRQQPEATSIEQGVSD